MSANNGFTDQLANLTAQAITAIVACNRGYEQTKALLDAFQAFHDNLYFTVHVLPEPNKADGRSRSRHGTDVTRLATLWARNDGFIRLGIRDERKIEALAMALQRFKQNVLGGIEVDRDGQVFAEMNRPIAEVTDDPALIAWCERHGIKLLGEALLIDARTKKEVLMLRKMAADRHISEDRLMEWIPTYAQDERILTVWKSEFRWVDQSARSSDLHPRQQYRTVEGLRTQERAFKDGGSELHAGMYMPISVEKDLVKAGHALSEIAHILQYCVNAQRWEGKFPTDSASRIFGESGTNLLPRLVALRRPNALIVAISRTLLDAMVPDEEASRRHGKPCRKYFSGWEMVFAEGRARAGIRTDRQLLTLGSPELFGEAMEVIAIALQLLGLKLGMTEDEADAVLNGSSKL